MIQYMCYLYYFSKVQEIYYMLVMVEKKNKKKKENSWVFTIKTSTIEELF